MRTPWDSFPSLKNIESHTPTGGANFSTSSLHKTIMRISEKVCWFSVCYVIVPDIWQFFHFISYADKRSRSWFNLLRVMILLILKRLAANPRRENLGGCKTYPRKYITPVIFLLSPKDSSHRGLGVLDDNILTNCSPGKDHSGQSDHYLTLEW